MEHILKLLNQKKAIPIDLLLNEINNRIKGILMTKHEQLKKYEKDKKVREQLLKQHRLSDGNYSKKPINAPIKK